MPRSIAVVFVLVSVFCGCASTNTQPSTLEELHALVGKRVQLEGRFDGPGKLADYIVLPADQVYLKGFTNGESIEYGSTISAEGLLEYYRFTLPPDNVPRSQVEAAPVPDHFYMTNAKVTQRR